MAKRPPGGAHGSQKLWALPDRASVQPISEFISGFSYWVEKVPDAIGRARMLLPAPGRLLSQYLPCAPTNSLTFQGSAERATTHTVVTVWCLSVHKLISIRDQEAAHPFLLVLGECEGVLNGSTPSPQEKKSPRWHFLASDIGEST